MGLTTFKVVDKSDPANIVEWHSNPEEYDTGKENQQKDVLKLWYSKTGSNKVGLGTYDYSTATEFRGSTKDVVPNYAIKQFTKTNKEGKEVAVIQVWYKLEERGINYTYFPKYLRSSTVEQLIKNNKDLNAQGVEYEPGKVVEDIEQYKDKNGVSYFNKLFNPSNGLYRKVSAESPINLFGEEY